jgi:tellurite resistance protein TehA-like permease
MVMATAIVAAGLRQARLPDLTDILLGVAASMLVILVAVSCWRAVAFPGSLRAWFARPSRAFSSFAVVAACAVLSAGLGPAGDRYPAAVLAGTAGAAWLIFTCLIPGRIIARFRVRTPATEADGTWYLWAVGTQSLAIAVASWQADGLIAARTAADVCIAAWLTGILSYLAVTVVVATRLLTAGPGSSLIAPYWVASGAASITALAAVRLAEIPGTTVVTAIRPAVSNTALLFWTIATLLLPVLVVATIRRRPRPIGRWRYRAEAWTIVFPLGMYAVSGWQLGTVAGFHPVRGIAAVAIWPAAIAWTATFAAMAASPLLRLRHWILRMGAPRRTRVNVPSRRFKYQAMVTMLPSDGGEPAVLPGPECRMIVRTWPGHAHHTDIFSALVATSWEQPPDSRHQLVTITVSGCEAGDCLDPGEHVTLWRGRDIADAVVTRRIFT